MKKYNETELNNIRKAGEILSETLLTVKKSLKQGMSTLQVDKIAEDFIISKGGEPCFKNYKGYGFATCLSVNEEVIHGMPRTDTILKTGDIISVDVGVRWNGYCTDACRTFGVGKISDEAQKLIDATRECFFVATKNLKAGSTIGDIATAIEDYIKNNTTYSILENYFGHGIGKNVHEEPLIPNYTSANPKLKANARKKLTENAVICIEPMINQGKKEVTTKKDGWTVITQDGKLAAHYENTLIIHKGGIETVTDKFV